MVLNAVAGNFQRYEAVWRGRSRARAWRTASDSLAMTTRKARDAPVGVWLSGRVSHGVLGGPTRGRGLGTLGRVTAMCRSAPADCSLPISARAEIPVGSDRNDNGFASGGANQPFNVNWIACENHGFVPQPDRYHHGVNHIGRFSHRQ